MQIKKIILATSLVVVGGLQALPASAGSDNAKTYVVHYTKAELGTANGSESVLARIQETANRVCIDEFGMERYLQRLEMQRCVKAVAKELVGKIGHENLDSAYASNKAMSHSAQRPKTMRRASR